MSITQRSAKPDLSSSDVSDGYPQPGADVPGAPPALEEETTRAVAADEPPWESGDHRGALRIPAIGTVIRAAAVAACLAGLAVALWRMRHASSQ